MISKALVVAWNQPFQNESDPGTTGVTTLSAYTVVAWMVVDVSSVIVPVEADKYSKVPEAEDKVVMAASVAAKKVETESSAMVPVNASRYTKLPVEEESSSIEALVATKVVAESSAMVPVNASRYTNVPVEA